MKSISKSIIAFVLVLLPIGIVQAAIPTHMANNQEFMTTLKNFTILAIAYTQLLNTDPPQNPSVQFAQTFTAERSKLIQLDKNLNNGQQTMSKAVQAIEGGKAVIYYTDTNTNQRVYVDVGANQVDVDTLKREDFSPLQKPGPAPIAATPAAVAPKTTTTTSTAAPAQTTPPANPAPAPTAPPKTPFGGAATQGPVTMPTADLGVKDPAKPGFQLISCDGVQKYVRDTNGKIIYDGDTPRLDPDSKPCDYNQLIFTFTRIVDFVLYLLTPIVLGMLLYTGFMFLTAGGDLSKLARAKKMVMPLLLGVFFITAAYLIVYKLILGNLLDDSGGIKKTDIINTAGNP